MAEYQREEFDKLYDDVVNYPTIEEYESDLLALREGRMTGVDFLQKYPNRVVEHMNGIIAERDSFDEKQHALVNHLPINEIRQQAGQKSYAEVNGFVHKYTEMDPRYDGFLFSGHELANGMVVLIEPSVRADVTVLLGPDEFYHARLYNRWFEVGKLSVEGTNVTMQANYEDGTKARLSLSVDASWYFKLGTDKATGKASVPVVRQEDLGTDAAQEKSDRVQQELQRLRQEDFGG